MSLFSLIHLKLEHRNLTCQPRSLKLTYSSCFLQACRWSVLLFSELGGWKKWKPSSELVLSEGMIQVQFSNESRTIKTRSLKVWSSPVLTSLGSNGKWGTVPLLQHCTAVQHLSLSFRCFSLLYFNGKIMAGFSNYKIPIWRLCKGMKSLGIFFHGFLSPVWVSSLQKQQISFHQASTVWQENLWETSEGALTYTVMNTV